MKKSKVEAKAKAKEFQEVVYAPPVIKITDVVIEQTVLGGGSIGDLPGEVW
ncbi:MAG: hypothetical protein GX281_06605 [Bacteroidales bacterium]|jgi:hypothetical protein|nr:hypothetical protein [Bacteroidales bacterium]NLK80367.1 hypothetical protein [Bacteroidales bacterium]